MTTPDDPRAEVEVLVKRHMLAMRELSTTDRAIDPAHPTAGLLASEKRQFDKRVAAIRAAQARALPQTLSPQAARLRLLQLQNGADHR